MVIFQKYLKTQKLNFLSFSKHKKDEEEKCPYEEFIEEQEETLKKNDKKQEIRS